MGGSSLLFPQKLKRFNKVCGISSVWKGDRQGELKNLGELTLITLTTHAHHEKQKKIEILPTLLYNLYMEEIKYLLMDFIDRFNAAEPPAKKQMIKEGK